MRCGTAQNIVMISKPARKYVHVPYAGKDETQCKISPTSLRFMIRVVKYGCV